MSLLDFITDFKNASEDERREFIELISPDLTKNSNFINGLVKNNSFVNMLVKNPNFRITLVKNLDFKEAIKDIANEYVSEEQIFDKLEAFPKKITELKEEIKNITVNGTVIMPASELSPIIPESNSDIRSLFIKDYIENEVKETPQGEKILYGKEIKDLIKRVIPAKFPELALKKGQNERKVKKDALDKIKKYFGNYIIVEQNPHGRHDTLVRLKPLLNVTS